MEYENWLTRVGLVLVLDGVLHESVAEPQHPVFTVVKYGSGAGSFPKFEVPRGVAGAKEARELEGGGKQDEFLNRVGMPCGIERREVAAEARAEEDRGLVSDGFFDDVELTGHGQRFEVAAVETRDLDFDAVFVEALFEE